jgi:hypothetical protein
MRTLVEFNASHKNQENTVYPSTLRGAYDNWRQVEHKGRLLEINWDFNRGYVGIAEVLQGEGESKYWVSLYFSQGEQGFLDNVHLEGAGYIKLIEYIDKLGKLPQ